MTKKKSLLEKLFGGASGGCDCGMEITEEHSPSKGGCCNMQIAEEAEPGECCSRGDMKNNANETENK